jgi:hypothetical protein
MFHIDYGGRCDRMEVGFTTQIEFHARVHMNFLANFLRRQLTSLELGNKIISLYLLHIPNKLKENQIKPLTIYIKTTGV